MEQIRARIREKRGADYTEAELQELATTNLQKFLDPKGVRSDLVEQFRKGHRPSEWPNYEFGETTLYDSHRGFIRGMRKLLRPVLKLFFNPDPIVAALHVQSQLNTELLRQQERESLRYELVHNLVVELTRASIEVQNLKMRVESLSSRMDFDERRARSLEQVVQYKKPAPRPAAPQAQAEAQPPAPGAGTSGPAGPPSPTVEGGEGGERRKRRRRRRRRPGSTLAESGAAGENRMPSDDSGQNQGDDAATAGPAAEPQSSEAAAPESPASQPDERRRDDEAPDQ